MPLLEDESVRKIGHDLKFDAVVLAQPRHHAARVSSSTRCWRAICSTRRGPGHPLEESSLEHLGYKALTEEDVCGRGAKALPFAQAGAGGHFSNFAGERADLARQLSNRLAPLLVTDQLESVYRRARDAARSRAGDIERAGIRIDGPALAAQSQHIEQAARAATPRESASSPARSSTSTHRNSSAKSCSRSCSCPRPKKTGKTRSDVHGGRSARGTGACPTNFRGSCSSGAG